MATAQRQETETTAVPTHEINGRSKKPTSNRPVAISNDNQNFSPDQATALEGTSRYSTPVMLKTFTLNANDLQRVQHRHTQYVGSIIHQLENATLAKHREKNADIVRSAINAVADELDRIQIQIDEEKTRIAAALEGVELEIDCYSNPLTYEKIPVQTTGALKWIDLLQSADELFAQYDKAVFANKLDQVERAALVTKVIKALNRFPGFVSNTNKGVDTTVKQLNQARAVATKKK